MSQVKDLVLAEFNKGRTLRQVRHALSSKGMQVSDQVLLELYAEYAGRNLQQLESSTQRT